MPAVSRVLMTFLLVVPALAGAIALPVSRRSLANGLTVLVHEDHSAPIVSTYVFYRCGSRNEQGGRTGLAHLFEHMMFNGSRKFGPGTFDDLVEGNGGSTNGYTTRDYTAYLNNAPREALETLFDLESDRMADLLITAENLEQERGIVMEERRLRVDDDIQGAMWEALYLHAFTRSPYRWHPVGFMADLAEVDLDAAQGFFDTCYAPNNALLVVAGDVESEAVFELATRYFGPIRPGPAPAPVTMAEPEQTGERRVVVRKRAELPELLLGYHAVPATAEDRPALDVAAQVLAGGRSARLSERLVRDLEIATDVDADLRWSIAADLFIVTAKAAPGHEATEVLRAIDAGIADLQDEGPSEAELRAAKRQLRASFLRVLRQATGKANQIGFFEIVFGDPGALGAMEAGWNAVSAADVQRAARRYLVRERRTVVELVPLAATEGAS